MKDEPVQQRVCRTIINAAGSWYQEFQNHTVLFFYLKVK